MGLRPTQSDEDAPVWGRLATGGRLSIGPLANSDGAFNGAFNLNTQLNFRTSVL